MVLQHVDVIAKADTDCLKEVAGISDVYFDPLTMFCAANPVTMIFLFAAQLYEVFNNKRERIRVKVIVEVPLWLMVS